MRILCLVFGVATSFRLPLAAAVVWPNGDVVEILTPAQKEFLSGTPAERRAKFVDSAYRSRICDPACGGSRPQPQTFRWTGDGAATVTVARASDGHVHFRKTLTGYSVAVDNFEIGQRYVWTVENAEGVSRGSFTTEATAPRLLRDPDPEGRIRGVRDLGGRRGLDGRRVRQGLVFRTSGFNRKTTAESTAVGESFITDANRSFWLEELGIRTDLDLRSDAERRFLTVSPLGPTVRFVPSDAVSYNGLFKKHGIEMFRRNFEVFLDGANYPIAFHCVAGQDRTGCLAYVLNAILGVDEDELMKDWESTIFWNGDLGFGKGHELIEQFRANLAKYPGANDNERCCFYVTNVCGCASAQLSAFRERMLEPADRVRKTAGDTGFAAVRAIDSAAWIGLSAKESAPAFTRFRKTFAAVQGQPLEIDVSADERYVLLLDGKIVGRGPDRGDVKHWTYRTYRFDLMPGEHVLEAVVTALGAGAPAAQMTYRGGSFIAKAKEPYDVALTTGVAEWTAVEVTGTEAKRGYNASGATVRTVGASFLEEAGRLLYATSSQDVDEASRLVTWQPAVVVRKAVTGDTTMAAEVPGWRLFPSELAAQTSVRSSPGRFIAARDSRGKKDDGVYAEVDLKDARLAALNGVLRGRPMTVAPKSSFRAVWDLGDYYTPYPLIRVRGGSNAVVRLRFSEAPRDAQREKGNRDEIVGKSFGNVFVGDELVATGGESTLTTPWWRAGRYAELTVETADVPLELVALELEDSHYSVGTEGSFSTPDDPSLDAVWKICRRGMEMCAHEMVMDCPYYEQMMYGGDARIQGLILSALGSDDALVRRVIDFYAFNQRDDGMVPMVYPSRADKASATYSLAWALMFGDYAMWHDDKAWLKARLPSLHHLLSGLAAYENGDGLLEDLPGWNFIDWVAEPEPWYRGDAPDGKLGKGENALNNLFYVLALQSGAKANRVVGDEAMAAVWDARAKRVAETLVAKYWDEKKGALADTLDHKHFSEHAQCLALLAGALPKDKAARAFGTLITAKDLSRTTVYFSHYLFETYLLYGRTDLILKRLELWRDFVKVGLKTPLESPSPTLNARSDCHAWGSHPIYHLITGVAGIRPGSEGFKTVRIAPAPGPLTRFKATCPHPKGRIAVDLVFENGACRGTVETPVPGMFVWQGHARPLAPGRTTIVR